MNDARYKWILYIIVVVIISTITIQVYWNYKNYQVNKQQLINDVQVSLDNAIDNYYANLAEKSTMGFVFNTNSQKDFFNADGKFDSIMESFEFSKGGFRKIDSLEANSMKGVSVFQGIKTDSLLNSFHLKHKTDLPDSTQTHAEWLKIEQLDSLSEDNFKILTSKVVISMSNNTLSLKKIDTLLKDELNRKKLTIDYGLLFDDFSKSEQTINNHLIKSSSLSTFSKSTFLPNDSTLKVYFTNETKTILKRILSGILISLLLVLAVISCLFYLLKIIKHQKQLAEVKNDLINNITHEFKTPIATISVALESIKNFNVIDDKEKTKSYLNMSGEQLNKLNIMVEKLLETATLNSDSLTLNIEKINLVEFINTLIEKQNFTLYKKIMVNHSQDNIPINIDVFHFENAINNIIDNAIKYGGDTILINLSKAKNSINISISDNGNSLNKSHKDKIFEQFYRVQKGNTHDVKGFGIGLYYTRKIIEKHDGTIQLDLDNNLTTFKIILPK